MHKACHSSSNIPSSRDQFVCLNNIDDLKQRDTLSAALLLFLKACEISGKLAGEEKFNL